MRINEAISIALVQAGIEDDVIATTPLSGGCIHNACRVDLKSGKQLVAKTAGAETLAQFKEEMRGLATLAQTQTVVAPNPIIATSEGGTAVLLMSYIEPSSANTKSWSNLGNDLAALHSADAGSRYGFDMDNHLGSTPQPNQWEDDWVEFNRQHRFGYQIKLATSKGLLKKKEVSDLNRMLDRLDDYIPTHPKPALLHGDLWSGNALATVDDHIAVIDPAPYIGDGWADIAMMQLFGGFPAACLDAYADAVNDHDRLESRIAVYQLYHLLNHINIFGRGYAGQAMGVLNSLGV